MNAFKNSRADHDESKIAKFKFFEYLELEA